MYSFCIVLGKEKRHVSILQAGKIEEVIIEQDKNSLMRIFVLFFVTASADKMYILWMKKIFIV